MAESHELLKSISYWSFPGGLEGKKDLVDAMREAQRQGFDAIEPAFGLSGPLNPKTTQAECDRIIEESRKVGIALSSLATGVYWDLSLTDDDPRIRRRAFDFTLSYIRCARMLGLDAVLVVPGAVDVFFKPDFEPVPYDRVWKRSVSQLRKLCKFAARSRVHICVENVWNKFLLSPLEMRLFVDEVASKWLGVYFDVGNVMLNGYPEQWIRILGKRIRRVHFKDFRTSVGTAAGFCELMEGDVPWAQVVAALKETGYRGYCTAELMPPHPALLKRASRAMDKIFAM